MCDPKYAVLPLYLRVFCSRQEPQQLPGRSVEYDVDTSYRRHQQQQQQHMSGWKPDCGANSAAASPVHYRRIFISPARQGPNSAAPSSRPFTVDRTVALSINSLPIRIGDGSVSAEKSLKRFKSWRHYVEIDKNSIPPPFCLYLVRSRPWPFTFWIRNVIS